MELREVIHFTLGNNLRMGWCPPGVGGGTVVRVGGVGTTISPAYIARPGEKVFR